MKPTRKVIIPILIIFVVLGTLAGTLAGRYISDNRKPNFANEYVLHVHPDMTMQDVIDSLYAGAGALRARSIERTFQKNIVYLLMMKWYMVFRTKREFCRKVIL